MADDTKKEGEKIDQNDKLVPSADAGNKVTPEKAVVAATPAPKDKTAPSAPVPSNAAGNKPAPSVGPKAAETKIIPPTKTVADSRAAGGANVPARKTDGLKQKDAPSKHEADTSSRQRLTREKLATMRKPEILAVASDRGYKALTTGKESMIQNFLDQQSKDPHVAPEKKA